MREDVWLSGVLARPVFAVDPGDDDFGRGGFYYAKVPVADVARTLALGARGFGVVDVNVTLVADAGQSPLPRSRVAVGPARPEHGKELMRIAESCFRYSRFHLDPALPRAAADRVKREWIRSYVERRRGIELLAALDDGRPVGFLAVLESGDARVIDLVGVASAAQGAGVGRALVSSFLERHAPHARELRVGTQIANVPSLRLYAACGFSIVAAAYILHLHVPAP